MFKNVTKLFFIAVITGNMKKTWKFEMLYCLLIWGVWSSTGCLWGCILPSYLFARSLLQTQLLPVFTHLERSNQQTGESSLSDVPLQMAREEIRGPTHQHRM